MRALERERERERERVDVTKNRETEGRGRGVEGFVISVTILYNIVLCRKTSCDLRFDSTLSYLSMA